MVGINNKKEVLVELHRQLAALTNPHVHCWFAGSKEEMDFDHALKRTFEAIEILKSMPDDREIDLFSFMSNM